MEEILFGRSLTATASIILCAALAAVGVMYLVRFLVSRSATALRRLSEVRYRNDAYAATEQLEMAIEEYKGRVALLDQYTADYLSAFNEGNWYQALTMLDSLDEAYGHLCELLSYGEYLAALSLAEFLVANGARMPDAELERIDERWLDLEFWQSDVDQVLMAVVKRLQQSAEETQRLGIERGRNRLPTHETLEAFKRKLVFAEK
jgi:hypothetical protein